MSKRVHCIMLIDDNPDDNIYHERVIRKNNSADIVVVKQSGSEALEYLETKELHEHAHPNIIFLDINMPQMTGWEFLEEYNKLEKEIQASIIVIMLTTSENPDDRAKASTLKVLSDFITKPLTKEILDNIINKYF